MRKYNLLLCLLLGICIQINAGNRSERQMREAAASALASKSNRASGIHNLKEFLSLSMLKIYGYESGGFAVVTIDDSFDNVIGVSNTKFDSIMPCGFKWWLETVNNNMQDHTTKQTKSGIRRAPSGVSPLITTIWGQERPFNDNCTYTNGTSHYQFVTGCTATAMAQIMNYHRFPISGTGSKSYTITYNKSFTVTFAEDFSQSLYDWESMLDDYSHYYNNSETDVHTQAVAKLMKDCGIAIHTNFSDRSHGSSASDRDAYHAFKDYYKYDSATKIYFRSDYEKADWLNIIYEAIDNGRPILYSGQESASASSGGHAFVIDGYDLDGKVDVNWGWDGQFNGYFDIDLLNPQTHHYNYQQTMIVAVPGEDDTVWQSVSVTTTGPGCIRFGSIYGLQVRNDSRIYKVKDGNNAILFFEPDLGRKLKSVRVNGTDVTSNVLDAQYEITKIQAETNVEVEFEDDMSSMQSEYNKYITLGIVSMTKTQTSSSTKVSMGLELTNSGNSSVKIKQLLGKDPDTQSILFSFSEAEITNGDITSNGSKKYSLTLYTDIPEDVVLEMEYFWNKESNVYISSRYQILSIQSSDYGKVMFDGISIGTTIKKFSIPLGDNATLDMIPNNNCVLSKLLVNDVDVTSEITNNQYVISNINTNISVNASFDSNYAEYPTVDGHGYVDLGLSSGNLWATTNYGAVKPEQAGIYDRYASAYWGENWRVPTRVEMQELLDECEWTWTEFNGMNGFDIKGPNGNSLFLPAAGKAWATNYHKEVGTTAYYLTSSEENWFHTWILVANSSSQKVKTDLLTDNITIRPILNKNQLGIKSVEEDVSERIIYTIDGKRIDNLQRGVNIVKYGNGKTKKIILK